MVNEEIVGGLVSALSRGESLQRAMMTFYNAGYPKEEIEGAAKVIYSKEGLETIEKDKSKINAIASRFGLVKKNSPKIIQNQNIPKKSLQKISSYGEYNPGTKQIANKGEREIKDLKKINIPPKTEIINKNVISRPPKIVQRISDYREGPPKQVNKIIIYLLVFVLLLLLGVLAAVFLFKDDLIGMFNNLGLG